DFPAHDAKLRHQGVCAPGTSVQSRSFPSWGKVRHISRSSCDASPEGVGRISRRPNGTPQPNFYTKTGADGRIRTGDPLFTKQLLCQLSYVGVRTDYMRGL